MSRLSPPLLLAMAAILPAMASETSLPDLIAVGAPARWAELASIEPSGKLKFRDTAGKMLTLRPSDLVRWSNPAPQRAADSIVLADGSRLGLAAVWGKEPAIIFDGQRGVARTASFGRSDFERSQAAAILWRLPPDDAPQLQIVDELATTGEGDGGSDLLLLDNGDRVAGTLLRIGSSNSKSEGATANASLKFDGDLGPVELPIDRVRGVRLSSENAAPQSNPRSRSTLLVGLRNGSLISAKAIRLDGKGLIIESPILGDLKLGSLNAIVSLQGISNQVLYLSDLEPASYRHEPYLDLNWKYAADRNALGGLLRTGGRTYPKGLGMHSASRLTFDLDGKYDRFAATIALDDAADGGGSVVFRVFLKPSDGGDWREAYASGVVRGGNRPQEVSVDLAGATQLALVVDYADRGDEGDYANWLDARLERTE